MMSSELSSNIFTALANCVAATGISFEEATEAMKKLNDALASTIEEKSQSIIQYSGIYAIVRDR